MAKDIKANLELGKTIYSPELVENQNFEELCHLKLMMLKLFPSLYENKSGHTRSDLCSQVGCTEELVAGAACAISKVLCLIVN